MNTDLLQLANYFFLVFHTALIFFNLFGWIWKPWRKAHLMVISLTFVSWTLLGVWYGFGYCPLTDWHWNILHALGHDQLPPSYVSFLFQRMLDWHFSDNTVDILTLGCALVALAASVKVNFFPPEAK